MTQAFQRFFKVAHHNANTGRPLLIYFKAGFINSEVAFDWLRIKRQEVKRLQVERTPYVTRPSNIWIEERDFTVPSWGSENFLQEPESASIAYILTLPPSQTAES